MPLSEQHTDNNKQSFWRRINWELYYYERVGNRLYFRITPFAIILMLAAALVGFTILIIDSIKNPPRETNINVTVPPATSNSPDGLTIQPAPPPPSSPKVGKRPAIGSPSPPTLNGNTSNRGHQKQRRFPNLHPASSNWNRRIINQFILNELRKTA